MSEHTKTPWVYVDDMYWGSIWATKGDRPEIRVASFVDCEISDETEANAHHIVHCVNNHERLVEALRDYRECIEAAHRARCGCGNLNQALARQEIAERKADDLLAQLEAGKGGE